MRADSSTPSTHSTEPELWLSRSLTWPSPTRDRSTALSETSRISIMPQRLTGVLVVMTTSAVRVLAS